MLKSTHNKCSLDKATKVLLKVYKSHFPHIHSLSLNFYILKDKYNQLFVETVSKLLNYRKE
jgi:hypothetical protein